MRYKKAAIIDFHLRPLKEIKNAVLNIVVDAARDLVISMKMDLARSEPCGIDISCGSCPIHGKRCMGCPITGHYLGSLW
jgi:formylmethanofuran dehydrogenase subunit C